ESGARRHGADRRQGEEVARPAGRRRRRARAAPGGRSARRGGAKVGIYAQPAGVSTNGAPISVPPSPGGEGRRDRRRRSTRSTRGGVKLNTSTEFATSLPPHPARLRYAPAGDPPPPGEGGTECEERSVPRTDSPSPENALTSAQTRAKNAPRGRDR